MARYKVGDQVISRPKSGGCAPAGSTCTVTAHLHYNNSIIPLYEVVTPEGAFRNYEDELEPLKPCEYCTQGKSFNTIYFGDVTISSYILGNRLNTDVSDDGFPGEEDGKQEKISHCPFCGNEVHEAPDEDLEEEFEEVE